MLAIQNFIFTHENWAELLAAEPYNLKIKWKDNLVMFNYDQIKSEHNDITNEARGLILDMEDNFKIVRKGFTRFYNYGESAAAQIDWNNIEVQEKVDGTLIMFYYYNGWHTSTRSTFDAVDAEVGASGLTFYDLVLNIIADDDKRYFINFNENYTYVFELVAPENRIVVKYNKPALYHLATINNLTGEEINIETGNWQRPSTYFGLTSLTDIVNYVNQFNGEDFEGVVVVDRNKNRIKIKNVNWLELHRLHNNGVFTAEDALIAYKTGESAEIISYFPERKELIDRVGNVYERIVAYAATLDKQNFSNKGITKKDFALGVANYFSGAYKPLMFKAWDNKAEEWIKAMKSEDFVNKFYNE